MGHHDVAKPAAAATADGPREFAKRDAPSIPETAAQGQDLLAKLDAARQRCEANAQIAKWIIELQARLWQARRAVLDHDCRYLLHDDSRRRFSMLKREIERLKLCIKLARERR